VKFSTFVTIEAGYDANERSFFDRVVNACLIMYFSLYIPHQIVPDGWSYSFLPGSQGGLIQ